MEQFSLEEYLKNPTRKIITREGLSARIICTDSVSGEKPVISLVNKDGFEQTIYHRTDGTCSFDEGQVNKYDLFFLPEKKSAWVFLYYRPDSDGAIFSFTSRIKSIAEEMMNIYKGFGLTEITWEE